MLAILDREEKVERQKQDAPKKQLIDWQGWNSVIKVDSG